MDIDKLLDLLSSSDHETYNMGIEILKYSELNIDELIELNEKFWYRNFINKTSKTHYVHILISDLILMKSKK